MNKALTKIIKAFGITAGIIGLAALVNELLFFAIGSKRETPYKLKTFKTRHGLIKFRMCGSGRPLLLVHSLKIGAGMHEWDREIAELAKTRRVYALDLLGYGYSDRPMLSYNSYLFVSLINSFVKNVIREKADAIGFEDGAMLLAACRAFEPDCYGEISGVGERTQQPPRTRDVLALRFFESGVLGTTAYNILASAFWLRRTLPKGSDVRKYHYFAHYAGSASKYPIAAYLCNYYYCDVKCDS